MLRYRLRLEPDDNGTVLVTSPDLPIVTYGAGEAEALHNAVGAIHTIVESMMRARDDIPLPLGSASAGPCYDVSLQAELKIRLHQAMKAAGLTRVDLGDRLGLSRGSVDRLFRLASTSKIEQIEQAFAALGKSVMLDVKDVTGPKAFERAA